MVNFCHFVIFSFNLANTFSFHGLKFEVVNLKIFGLYKDVKWNDETKSSSAAERTRRQHDYTSTCPCVDLITQAHVHAFRHTTKSLSTAGRTIEVHLVTQAHVHKYLVRPAADDDFGMIKLE